MARMKPELRRVGWALLRLALSASLVGLLVWKIGPDALWVRLGALQWGWAALAIALACATMALHALRWRLVVLASGARMTPQFAVSEIWIGYFFSQLLPTSIGGDAVRAYRHYRFGEPLGAALRGVLVDRVFGLLACVALGVASVPLLVHYSPGGVVTNLAAGVIALALCGCLVLFRPPRWLTFLLPDRLAEQLRLARTGIVDRRFRARAAALSLLMQLVMGGCLASLSLGLALEVNPVWVAILLQPATLVTVLPISLAGWGLREGALVALLGSIGVPAADALPLSLSFGGVILVASLPGWVALVMVERDTLISVSREAGNALKAIKG